tara:strand:- start:2197 stop:2775 length:579 start_codon:yes stop_codon:yes gene_type:complete
MTGRLQEMVNRNSKIIQENWDTLQEIGAEEIKFYSESWQKEYNDPKNRYLWRHKHPIDYSWLEGKFIDESQRWAQFPYDTDEWRKQWETEYDRKSTFLFSFITNLFLKNIQIYDRKLKLCCEKERNGRKQIRNQSRRIQIMIRKSSDGMNLGPNPSNTKTKKKLREIKSKRMRGRTRIGLRWKQCRWGEMQG